jgi:transcriptional regulator with XRE-family HTH domain
MSKPKTFGERLKSLREQAELSQAELATRAGLSLGIISHLELGRYSPKWETVCALADALKVSVQDFRERSKP